MKEQKSMSTPITAEAIFDKHAVALGLPKRKSDQSLDTYARDYGRTEEAARALAFAAEAAAVADHADVHHWLNQARQHMPQLKK
jgi:hypothetical protein